MSKVLCLQSNRQEYSVIVLLLDVSVDWISSIVNSLLLLFWVGYTGSDIIECLPSAVDSLLFR